MNTTENNKIIAEFMNQKYYEIKCTTIENVSFHNDWNWLMEVVEKIESLSIKEFNSFNVIIDKEVSSISCCFDYNGVHSKFTDEFEEKHWLSEEKGSKIERTYKLCIAFIKWYNEQKILNP